ncbi:MAG TPA: hypothetical protein VG013_02750 [Gemmataceae bacterium]|jgi:hypothetical protein|nr:hypothetical protein [Gemmataceae bacterium]
MWSQPWSYAELIEAAACVLGAMGLAGLAAAVLAARKGYHIGLWACAGATVVGLAALAFLPAVDGAGSVQKQERRRQRGNKAGGYLAAAAVVAALAVSFATNPGEDELKRFVKKDLPQSHDPRVAEVMANAQWWGYRANRHSLGLFSTATIQVSGQGSVKLIGFWGAWRGAARAG